MNKSDMYKSILDLPNHIKKSLKFFDNNSNLKKDLYFEIDAILILGMGGSAITGLLIRELLKDYLSIPIYVNQNYTIPKWVNKKTLVIACSYSGNTEETLISCEECINNGCKIIAFTTGGELIDLLSTEKYEDYVMIPKGLQPRAAIGYSFSLMLMLLNKIGIIDDSFINDLKASINPLLLKSKEYSLTNKNNIAYEIALNIHTKNPIIYSEDGIFNIIAYRFKCQLAENSKILSFNNTIPEMNHNEIEAFTEITKSQNNLILIWLNDSMLYDRNKKRIKITSKILQSKVDNQLEIFIEFDVLNNNKIFHYLTYINLVDWISYHCAILNKVDPMIIPNINKLKNTL